MSVLTMSSLWSQESEITLRDIEVIDGLKTFNFNVEKDSEKYVLDLISNDKNIISRLPFSPKLGTYRIVIKNGASNGTFKIAVYGDGLSITSEISLPITMTVFRYNTAAIIKVNDTILSGKNEISDASISECKLLLRKIISVNPQD